jgi:phage terminase small subunit
MTANAVAAPAPKTPPAPIQGQPPIQAPEPSKTPFFDALEPKRQKFVREWLVDFNGTKAAIRAGYSKKSANEQAAQILAKLSVRAAVDELMRIEAGVTRSRILEEAAAIAFADPNDVMEVDRHGDVRLRPFDEIEPHARRAIASIKQKPNEYGQERELKLHDKIAALQLLARATGLTKDAPAIAVQTNVTTNVGVLVVPAVLSESEWEAQMRGEAARVATIENQMKKVA